MFLYSFRSLRILFPALILFFCLASFGSGPGVLPVSPIEFSGVISSGAVKLHWKNNDKTIGDYFSIERSLNGYDWEVIGKVNVKAGSSETQSYGFTDEASDPNMESELYYRIQQIDFDGKSEYSGPVRIQLMNEDKWGLVFLSNPVSEQLMCCFYTKNKGMIRARIYNIMGAEVDVSSFEVQRGSNLLQFDIESLQEGIYFIKTADAEGKGLFKSFVISR
jgi:hypothetical protein